MEGEGGGREEQAVIGIAMVLSPSSKEKFLPDRWIHSFHREFSAHGGEQLIVNDVVLRGDVLRTQVEDAANGLRVEGGSSDADSESRSFGPLG